MSNKLTDLKPVQLSIEPMTRLLLVKQGDNTVKLNRNDVIGIKRLRGGFYKEGVYTSNLIPKNRCTVDENGNIIIVCSDEYESNVVTISNHKKLDDLSRINEFIDKHRAEIAWEREFKGRW